MVKTHPYSTNTGYTWKIALQSADSLIVYEFCSLLTSLPFCISDTIVNPCYQPNNNQCTVSNFVVTPDTSSCSGAMMNLVFGYSGINFGASGYTISTVQESIKMLLYQILHYLRSMQIVMKISSSPSQMPMTPCVQR
ncbi:MAG: hypothetical protein IPO94_14885 [Saprospiraceae bacterium]|nr:hypothetical protein [Saprospiraceae bacterium]